MYKLPTPSVDVIIPVYNAIEQTRRCIDSIIVHLGCSIEAIYIQDDASNVETRTMLTSLPYKQLNIYHAPQNQGYGKSVNEAVVRSNADLILVLNSDIEVYENFLPLLCKALIDDPELAVISPVHDKFFKYDVSRYQRRTGGYIVTYRLKGYAFLTRRNLFIAMGGFDAQFGRGYFEDTDLGRRLDEKGWRMGVHPDAYVRHEGGASFGRSRSYWLLVEHNRALYLSRYPEACQNILLVSGQCTLAELPIQLANAAECVLRRGGSIHWLTPVPLPQLSCMQMHNSSVGVKMIMHLMLRGWLRQDKRITTVWILPGVSGLLRTLLAFLVYARRLKIQEWDNAA